ncbi:MAG: hypothetical protein ACUVQY_01545 [Thermoproteota archaeon]
MKKIIGVYGSIAPAERARELNWKPIEVLQDKIGLNLIILGVPETGHYLELLPEAKSDVKELISDSALKVNAEETERMKQIVREAHDRGIKVWSILGGFAEMWEDPEMVNRDIYGNMVVPSAPEVWSSISWCPSKPHHRLFMRSLAVYVTDKYDIDGWTFTHVRFSPPGLSPWHFFSCACEDCARKANQLGYDFNGMLSGLKLFIENLKKLGSREVSTWLDTDLGFLDVIQFLGPERQIIDWIDFRCQLIFSMFDELYSSIKDTKPGITVGQDIFPPSFSLLVGHKYSNFTKRADFLSPLLSHPMLFTMLGFVEFTKLIRSWNANVRESELLALLYLLFGYSHLNLPNCINCYAVPLPLPSSDYEHPYINLAKVIATEAKKARSLSGTRPIYPVIAAHKLINAQGAYERTKAILDIAGDGILFQFGELPGPHDNLETISKLLK